MKLAFDIKSSAANSARSVAEKLMAAGHQAVLAGGAVRDMLLGLTPKDFDIATDARPEQVLKIFRKTQKVGVAFGVVLVYDYSRPIEVATFRSDGNYSDGRRPDSVTFTDAKADASRRDFTVNGLFYDFRDSNIIDHVGGLADLESKTLRAIGEPALRFGEDYLRMLRALRFAVTYRLAIEPVTWAALQQFAPRIADISPERVHRELQLIFDKGHSDTALQLFRDSGLQAAVFRDMPCFSPTLEGARHLEGGDFPAIVSLLLYGQAPDQKCVSFLEGLRCSNVEKKEILEMLGSLGAFFNYASLDMSARKRLLRRFNAARCLYILPRLRLPADLLQTVEADCQRWDEAALFPHQLLTGSDLIGAGLKPGPILGQCLEFLETEALEGRLQSPADAWAALKKAFPSQPFPP